MICTLIYVPLFIVASKLDTLFLCAIAGPAIGIALAFALGCRLTKRVALGLPILCTVSFAQPVWVFPFALCAQRIVPSISTGRGLLDASMVAVTGLVYAVMLGVIAWSWRVVAVILTATVVATLTAASVTQDLSLRLSVPMLFACIVLTAALDTLLRAVPRRFNICPSCNYDLRGLRESICPECGMPMYAADAL